MREDAARAGPDTVTVVAISPLLRALILAACEQLVMWDEDGPVQHVVALALHGIGHAATCPISVPVCTDARLRLDTFAEMAAASARTLARLFRRETGRSFRAWRRQLRLTEGLAALSEGETPARWPGRSGIAVARRSAWRFVQYSA